MSINFNKIACFYFKTALSTYPGYFLSPYPIRLTKPYLWQSYYRRLLCDVSSKAFSRHIAEIPCGNLAVINEQRLFSGFRSISNPIFTLFFLLCSYYHTFFPPTNKNAMKSATFPIILPLLS